MTKGQIMNLAESVGFPRNVLDLASAIALAESSGNPSARNLSPIEDSRGLWQINIKAHSQYANVNLYDPKINASAALAISSGGSNWRPWTAFRSGAYRKYLTADGGISPVWFPKISLPQLTATGNNKWFLYVLGATAVIMIVVLISQSSKERYQYVY